MYGNYVPVLDESSFDTSELVKKFAIENGLSDKQFVIYGNSVKNTLDEATQFSSYIQDNNKKNIINNESDSYEKSIWII